MGGKLDERYCSRIRGRVGFWNNKKGDDTEGKKASVVAVAGKVAPVAAEPAPVVAPAPVAPPERAPSDAESLMKVRSALGPGTVIQGKLSFDAPVSIDGKLGGEVFSSKALLVGKTGFVEAKVEVASLIVFGQVRGSIVASERVEIRAGAVVEAEIVAPIFVVEEGGRFNGTCQRGAAVRPINQPEAPVKAFVADPASPLKRSRVAS